MGVNITTIVYLRVLIIEIGSTIVLMVVEAQGIYIYIIWGPAHSHWFTVDSMKVFLYRSLFVTIVMTIFPTVFQGWEAGPNL